MLNTFLSNINIFNESIKLHNKKGVATFTP